MKVSSWPFKLLRTALGPAVAFSRESFCRKPQKKDRTGKLVAPARVSANVEALKLMALTSSSGGVSAYMYNMLDSAEANQSRTSSDARIHCRRSFSSRERLEKP